MFAPLKRHGAWSLGSGGRNRQLRETQTLNREVKFAIGYPECYVDHSRWQWTLMYKCSHVSECRKIEAPTKCSSYQCRYFQFSGKVFFPLVCGTDRVSHCVGAQCDTEPQAEEYDAARGYLAVLLGVVVDSKSNTELWGSLFLHQMRNDKARHRVEGGRVLPINWRH